MSKSIYIGAGSLLFFCGIALVTGQDIIANIWGVGGLVLLWIGSASRRR